jgi:uncharacterized protein YbaP (TraB family)
MKYCKLFFALVAWLFTSDLIAQNSVLWQISGNGLTAPSYLMGTLKFIGEKEFFIPAAAGEKIKQCKIFAIEDQVDHHAQHELNKAVHFPSGKSLKTFLNNGDYQTVINFFQSEFGISREKFESHYAQLIPLALSITMTRLSLGENVRFYDIELLKIAKKNKLEAYSLEPVDREAKALNSYSMDDQIKALLHSISNFDVQKNEFQKLVASYPQGQLEEMFGYTLHPIENNPVFIEEFYSKRNLEWLPKIDKMVKDKPAFIALGLSHLEGEQGMLQLLKLKGYVLTPVPVSR